MAKGHRNNITKLLRLEDLSVTEVVEEVDEDVVVIKVQPRKRRRSSVLTAAQSIFTDTAMQDRQD